MAELTSNRLDTYRGNDKVLIGIILGLLSFWLFAMTMLIIQNEVQQDLGIEMSALSLAVTLTSLVSGVTIVMLGKFADRYGRAKFLRYGFYAAILGSLLIAITPTHSNLTVPVMVLGRVLQGLSGAFIMPSSLALIRQFWDEKERQRAFSLWSMGTWGGMSFATFVGTNLNSLIGWRWIFIIATITSIVGLLLVREIPNHRVEGIKDSKFDVIGMLVFMVSVICIMLVVNFGSTWGWGSPITLLLMAFFLIGIILFASIEANVSDPFVNIRLFGNKTFTGATISNFILNSTAGVLVVVPALMSSATDYDQSVVGFLSIGYGVVIISFMRMGEKLLQRFGPRKPMVWGALIVLLSFLVMAPTNMMREGYLVFMAIGYALFGLGLAFYATPSIDAAISTLPLEAAASGSGIYKMASSLGSAFGIAISSTIYYSLVRGDEALSFINSIFVGEQSNVLFRQSAMIAILFNVVIVLFAVFVICVTVPKLQRK